MTIYVKKNGNYVPINTLLSKQLVGSWKPISQISVKQGNSYYRVYPDIGSVTYIPFVGTGGISGNILDIRAVSAGQLDIGSVLDTGTGSPGILSNTVITKKISGIGGVGTYEISPTYTNVQAVSTSTTITSNTAKFTVPPGVLSINIGFIVSGGGGGGGAWVGDGNNFYCGCGGGSGGYYQNTSSVVTSGEILSISVGKGGGGGYYGGFGVTGGKGGDGGSSYITSPSYGSITCTGGGGGYQAVSGPGANTVGTAGSPNGTPGQAVIFKGNNTGSSNITGYGSSGAGGPYGGGPGASGSSGIVQFSWGV